MRAFLLAAALGVAATTSWAQIDTGRPFCATLTQMAEGLEANYGEIPVNTKEMPGGYFITVFINAETSSWTVVAHDVVGGCIIRGGMADTLPADYAQFVGADT